MPHCAACFKEIYSSQLKTIGEQVVCSLSCVGLLKANEKDSCHYCKRPVWKDNYYTINNNNYCSDFCKELILEELHLPKDSDLINHFNDNVFTSIGPIDMKNTMKLREEVLKVYNDFKFDIIGDSNENINQNENHQNNIISKINNKDELNKENKENKNLKDMGHTLTSDLNNINNKYLLKKNTMDLDQSKDRRKNIIQYKQKEISKENDLTNVQSNFNNINLNKDKSYQTNDYKIKKTYTFNKIPYNINNKINDNNYNNSIIERINIINKENNNYMNICKEENNKTINETADINNNFDNNNYYTINQNLNNNLLSNKNRIFSNDKNKYKNYMNNYNSNVIKNNNPLKLTKNNKICRACLGAIGNIKFLDRDGNNFCSDKCKKEFLSLKN